MSATETLESSLDWEAWEQQLEENESRARLCGAAAVYQAWCAENGFTPGEVLDEKQDSDPFAHHKLIAADLEAYGKVQNETLQYIETNRKTATLEAIRRGFLSQAIALPFVDGDFLDQKGDSMLRSQHEAIGTAIRLSVENPELRFYVARAIFDFQNLLQDVELMRHGREGEGRMTISPCETENQRGAKEVGMFPTVRKGSTDEFEKGSGMAIVRLAFKENSGTLKFVCFSLHNATRDLLRKVAAKRGVVIPQNARDEDFLNYPIPLEAEDLSDLYAHAEAAIADFDHALQQAHPDEPKPYQGRFGEIDPNYAHRFTTECQQVQRCQVEFDTLMATMTGSRPQALPVELRRYAQRLRELTDKDGGSLLAAKEQELIRSLLSKDKVHISQPQDAKALNLLIAVFETGVHEAVYQYMGGDAKALHALPDWQHLAIATSIEDQTIALGGHFAIVKTAEEEGRFSAACGSEMSFGKGKLGVAIAKAMSISSAGFAVPFELAMTILFMDNYTYLTTKYPNETIIQGTCNVCDGKDYVGSCGCCGDCDKRDTLNPGYITERLKQKERAAARRKNLGASAVQQVEKENEAKDGSREKEPSVQAKIHTAPEDEDTPEKVRPRELAVAGAATG